MNRISKYIVTAAAVFFAAYSCTRPAEPVRYDQPVVEFPMPEGVLTAVVGEPVNFEAKLVGGQKVSILWSIDGIPESSSQQFTYVFKTPGVYDVHFEARNGSGVVERSYTVDVSDSFSVKLSIKDSTVIYRKQLEYLKVAAIVDLGSDISHSWTVDGEQMCDELYFGTLQLKEFRPYTVEYNGYNGAGNYKHTFTVEVLERELEMSYSILDPVVSMFSGKYLQIAATPLYGGTGLQQSWKMDGVEISTEASINWLAPYAGTFQLTYEAVNAKGETASREWTINVEASGYVWDNFEDITSLGAWWTLAQNQPGIELVENPYKTKVNGSAQCMRDKVNGSGGTSGYFDLTVSKILAAHPDCEIGKYTTLRFLVHLNGNNYYPFVQINGKTQIPSVNPPSSKNEWVVLEYKFSEPFKSTDKFTIRAMRDQGGASVSGYDENTNNRTVYFDDFEFVD